MDKVKLYFFAIAIALLFAGRAEARLFGLVIERGAVEAGLDAVDASGRAVAIGESFLYEIDPNTGLATLIGDTGYSQCVGMDFHPFTRELYAVCLSGIIEKSAETKLMAGGDYYLVRIDIKTGAATEIGPTGIIPGGGIRSLTDVSFRSDGVLFGHGQGEGGLILGTFDLKTGEFTLIGPDDSDPTLRPGGLAFLADGRLFSADTTLGNAKVTFDTPEVLMHLRDQIAGAADLITNLKLQLTQDQLPFVTSMDTNPADGLLYGYILDQGAVLRNVSQRLLEQPYIVTIDPDSGIVDWRAPTIDNVAAIAFLDVQHNIPTMGEWGLIALASLMLLGSLIVLKRRHKTSAV